MDEIHACMHFVCNDYRALEKVLESLLDEQHMMGYIYKSRIYQAISYNEWGWVCAISIESCPPASRLYPMRVVVMLC